MGGFGQLAYFVEARPTPIEPVLRAVCELLLASEFSSVAKYEALNATVEHLSNGYSLVEEEELIEMPEILGEHVTIDEAVRMAAMHSLVSLVPKVEGVLPFVPAITRDMPPEIRGDAYVHCPTIMIGPYHWYQPAQWEDDRVSIYHGHAQFTVSLYGYRDPHNWDEYTRRIFEIPEFRKFQADLEAILGPVKRCIVWSV